MKHALALLIAVLVVAPVLAQEIITLTPLSYHTKNPLYIEEVEDLRSVKKSIGQVQKGMLNTQIPAVLTSDLDVFLKGYLNAALGERDAAAVIHIKVVEFWISETTYATKEVGRLQAEFEIYQRKGDYISKLTTVRFDETFQAMDVTKGHGGNIFKTLENLIYKIDLALMPSEVNAGGQVDTLQVDTTGYQSYHTDYEKPTTTYTQSTRDVSDFGGVVSLGIALGGGGIVGVPLRVYPADRLSFEVGGYFRPFVAVEEKFSGNEVNLHAGIMLAGGLDIYVNKKFYSSPYPKMTGVFLKGGHSFGNYPETFGAFGWTMERFRSESSSFSASVGVGVSFLDKSADVTYALFNSKAQPFLYFKLHWGWYVVKRAQKN